MVLQFFGFELDAERAELRRPDGGMSKLRPKALEMLRLFAVSSGRVLSKQELLEAVRRTSMSAKTVCFNASAKSEPRSKIVADLGKPHLGLPAPAQQRWKITGQKINQEAERALIRRREVRLGQKLTFRVGLLPGQTGHSITVDRRNAGRQAKRRIPMPSSD